MIRRAPIARIGEDATDELVYKLTDRLAADVRGLEAQLRTEEFNRDVLKQELELARTARTALETKVQEAMIQSATSGRAVVSPGPVVLSMPPPLSRSAPLAGSVGLLLGAIGAVAVDYAKERRRVAAEVRLDGHAEVPVAPATAAHDGVGRA